MKMSNDAINLFLTSNVIANRNGFNYLPEIIGLGTLAIMEDSPLHRFFIKAGIEQSVLVQKVSEFYKKHFPEEEERIIKYNEMIESFEEFDEDLISEFPISEVEDYDNYDDPDNPFVTLEMSIYGETQNREIVITKELYKIVQTSVDIAEKLYDTDTITNHYILAAFAENTPDVYVELLTSCLGTDLNYSDAKNNQVEKKITIPKGLEGFLTVMNNKYSADEEYCKILGREHETESLIKILSKATKRNAILVGEPGVGKTAIVEKFVWSIVKGTCHERFKNSVVLSLDVTSIIAGTKYRGMAEARFQELVKYLEEQENCILFIDEIHTVLGAGACKDGELDLANSLKPILARGDTQVIGATTVEEYERVFSRDGALKRRFEKIVVNEPKSIELYDMIKNQILNLQEFHHTKISKELVDFTILYAACFNFETKNPDRTLDLLDRAMASAELKGKNEVDKEDILENFEFRRKQFEKMPEKRKKAVAYHEAGHYIIQRFSPELQYLNTLVVSIMPAEDYLGINVFEEDEYVTPSTNREFYIQLIAKLLGGRRAEKLYTKELSAGANSDLAKATQIAKDMITRYGLDEKLSEDRVYLRESENPMYTDNIIEKINNEIDDILFEARIYADGILNQHQLELEMLVDELMKNGILSKEELDRIFTNKKTLQLITKETTKRPGITIKHN